MVTPSLSISSILPGHASLRASASLPLVRPPALATPAAVAALKKKGVSTLVDPPRGMGLRMNASTAAFASSPADPSRGMGVRMPAGTAVFSQNHTWMAEADRLMKRHSPSQ